MRKEENELRVRLHERWRMLSLSQARSQLSVVNRIRLPQGTAVLVPAGDSTGHIKILSQDIARRLCAWAGRDEPRMCDAGLPPRVLRILDLDGVVRVMPPQPPEGKWRRAAAADSVSLSALRWGAAFEDLAAEELARRLYGFGRLPVTPMWQRKLPDEETVGRWLDVDGVARRVDRTFHHLPRTNETWMWRRWARPSSSLTTKLYVCCRPEDLATVFRACLPVMRHPAVTGFKVGFDLATVLRPDKFVVFVSGDRAAAEVASAMTGATDSAAVHPLPFTSPVVPDGLVAAAVDPPDWDGRPQGQERASWRLHVCRLAAETLWAKRRELPWQDRVAAALERLSLGAVDTRRWAWAAQGGAAC